MGTFSRLFDMASKAMDKTSSPTPGRSADAGSQDWRSIVRTVADKVTGDDRPAAPAPSYAPRPSSGRPDLSPPAAGAAERGSAADRAAIARYQYLLQTADPHQVEPIHREAFARLTPEQRAQVEAEMASELPPTERPRSSAPADLARAGARAEAMRPGILAGLLARSGRRGSGASAGRSALAGAGLAGAGGLLVAVAGGAIATSIAAPLLADALSFGVDFESLAGGVDLGALAEGADLAAMTEGVTGGLGEAVGGFGEQVGGIAGGLSEGLSNFGLGDLLGR